MARTLGWLALDPGKVAHLRKVERLDQAIVRQVSRWPAGSHDDFLKDLSAAATKGKLWFGVAGVLGVIPGKPRNAAIHGLLALGIASAVTNLGFKTLLPRARPLPEHLPVFRFVHPQPSSSSMPSGHSASAIAFTLGVAFVHPPLGALLAPVAAGVAYSRVHTGAHWPSDVLFGSALGAGAALLTRKWWPLRPPPPAAQRSSADAPSIGEGEGLSIAVNTLGGSYLPETEDNLREIFPKSHIHLIAEGEDVETEINAAAKWPGTKALGVWGGDGTVGTAAAAAVGQSIPLLVLPGGTLNHFARDVDARRLEGAIGAANAGTAAWVDLGHVMVGRGVDGKDETVEIPMLNTASIGVYPNLVRRRERLQAALGKPLAGLVAGLRTFGAARPTSLRIDGVPHKLWILYVGRGRYYPRDLAPLTRPILDDGILDIRMVSADESFARLRLLWAVLTGTAETSDVTHLSETTHMRVEAIGEPLVLAIDGEPLPGVRTAEFTVRRRALRVYSPLP
ncbi:bifunctional phosphatase PAP2/diacylglycerol kinase family protein [bacterium RCC_150]